MPDIDLDHGQSPHRQEGSGVVCAIETAGPSGVEGAMMKMDPILRFVRPAPQVRDVAARLGLNMGAAVIDGTLSPQEWRCAAQACDRCPTLGDCSDWIGAHSARLVTQPPGFCPNGALLERLLD